MRPGAPVTRGSAVVLESGESVILPPGMAKAYQKGYDQGISTTYVSGPDEYVQTGNLVVRRCRHQQAEPVLLVVTGELVACICVDCLEQLPARHIEDQRLTAERVAYGTHEDPVEITAFGKADRKYTCTRCGSWLSDSTWPTLHD